VQDCLDPNFLTVLVIPGWLTAPCTRPAAQALEYKGVPVHIYRGDVAYMNQVFFSPHGMINAVLSVCVKTSLVT